MLHLRQINYLSTVSWQPVLEAKTLDPSVRIVKPQVLCHDWHQQEKASQCYGIEPYVDLKICGNLPIDKFN